MARRERTEHHDEGEMSAFGLPGVLVSEVLAESALAKAGLRKDDVILSVNGAEMADTATLRKHSLPANVELRSVPRPEVICDRGGSMKRVLALKA